MSQKFPKWIQGSSNVAKGLYSLWKDVKDDDYLHVARICSKHPEINHDNAHKIVGFFLNLELYDMERSEYYKNKLNNSLKSLRQKGLDQYLEPVVNKLKLDDEKLRRRVIKSIREGKSLVDIVKS